MRFVFDSSSLIALSQTCLVDLLAGLKEKMNADFLIPSVVEQEVVGRPLHIKRFELNAVRIKKAVDSGVFIVKELQGEQDAQMISGIANNCLFVAGRPIQLLQGGEIAALALALQENAQAFVIDERTTRMLIEAPRELLQLMQERYRQKISMQKERVAEMRSLFGGLNIIRSVELVALAAEQGLLQQVLPAGKQSLEAALYAVKYNGCAVSSMEIDLFLRNT
ncbi:MAG: hypothetical protein Q8N60_01110 [Candidatus Diapherotrites archaeon]|nr:hypothetical protein [Candidatus Diapherotrites archaeon]